MRPRIGVVCMEQIGKALLQAIEVMQLDAEFTLSDCIVQDESQLPAELAKSDVLLSSGHLVKILRRITEKPIIKIEPSLFDILLAYSNAVSHHIDPVIILPSESGPMMVNQVQNIFSLRIAADFYGSFDDVDRMILHYQNEGYHCVIGSGLVCERAEAMGMKSIFVYPQESLQSFIQLSYDTALSLCKETELNQKLSTIFRYSQQGILFTDAQGLISIYNKRAEAILKTEGGNLTGRSIAQFFPQLSLNTAFREQRPVHHLMCRFSGESFIASIVPILSKDELSNVMVSIEDVQTIQRQEQHIRNALAQRGFVAKHRFENLETCSPVFELLIQTAKKFARSEDCVVILGETGTGKEVLAQSIHNHSTRAGNPFVAVNCSAISESLLESELFGYDEGAFTGAKRGGKQGYFEVAHKGTIFLDEISELSLPLQSKLLRVIQEKQLIHVGGSKVINFDARVIAATNRNLWDLVQQKKFREDLYYRLAVLELEIPPLRLRQQDIMPMFLNFVLRGDNLLAVELQKHREELGSILCSHSWPGNVRELENFVKTLLVQRNPADTLEAFLELVRQEIERRKARSVHQERKEKMAAVLTGSLEYQRIQAAILEAEGNYTKAAALLGISRVTLWRKLKALQKD